MLSLVIARVKCDLRDELDSVVISKLQSEVTPTTKII